REKRKQMNYSNRKRRWTGIALSSLLALSSNVGLFYTFSQTAFAQEALEEIESFEEANQEEHIINQNWEQIPTFESITGIQIDTSQLLDIAGAYLEAPYRLGGRGNAQNYSAPIDCSGYVTTVYKRYLGTVIENGKSTTAAPYGWKDVDGSIDRYGIGTINYMTTASWTKLLMHGSKTGILNQPVYHSKVCKIYKKSGEWLAEEPEEGWDFYSPGDIVMYCSKTGVVQAGGSCHMGLYIGNGLFINANYGANRCVAVNKIEDINYHRDSSGYSYFRLFKMVSPNKNTAWLPEKHSVIYNLDGGQNNVNNPQYLTPYKAYPLKAPSKAGYTFAGWYLDADYQIAISSIPKDTHEDVQIFAKWTPMEYPISYVLNGGTNSEENPKTYNTTQDVSLQEPVKKGYTFNGWYTTSTFKEKKEEIKPGEMGNKKFYAKWILDTYSISYETYDGVNPSTNPKKYNVNTAYTLKAPTKQGYKFMGWYTEPEFVNKITAIKKGTVGDLQLYANWILTPYQITYVLGGGKNSANNPDQYNKSQHILLEDPTKNGYTFDGWYTNSTFKTANNEIVEGSTGVKKFYAKWILNKYSISYEMDGGINSAKNPKTFTVNQAYTLYSPTKTGYKFGGWYTDPAFTNKITSIKKGTFEDLTLYAMWIPNSYTITYFLDGGVNSLNNPGQYTCEDHIVLEAPVKEGFEFAGWYKEAKWINPVEGIDVGSSGNKVLYAKWNLAPIVQE
ncbi:MAG: InlB B-repeat-containing protein, partial [Firmicutes bacterium]|nr:InlB B-repeat-containing protein [Bacillota bacterium]